MERIVRPARALRGRVEVPGDKSLSHRALILGALARGRTRVRHLATGADVRSTATVLGAAGVDARILPGADGSPEAVVEGVGIGGLREPGGRLDCGNSGTTMRLVAGLLAGHPFASVLVGDASLSRRPMTRIAEPLTVMGAEVTTAPEGRPPLRIRGGRLRGVTHRPAVASAQVKSCLLLAGLHGDGATTVIESLSTRDHTERLLASMGADVDVEGEGDGARVTVRPGARLAPLEGRVPGDPSSAAYWVAAAALGAGSDLELAGVGVNPGRDALLRLLADWGARIERRAEGPWHGEPVATLRVRGAQGALRGGVVGAEAVPGLIDELPLLALLGPWTEEGVEIRGAGELRHKESDRIAATAAAIRALGGSVDEFPEGLAVAGGTGLDGGAVAAAGDHRIALAVAAVATAARGPVRIRGAEAAEVSYPEFYGLLERHGA